MAKPVIKKSAARQFAESAPIATEKKTRNRETVLLKVTASKLHDLIGDTPIGVSRKELKALILKSKSDAVLAEAGL